MLIGHYSWPSHCMEFEFSMNSRHECPFEPLWNCSLFHLSIKTAFIITITSTRKISELHTLMANTPPTTFYKDKVVLRPHSQFLLKVVSDFHVNQSIHLPVFFPKPHTSKADSSLHYLNTKRVLLYYLSRTKVFRPSPVLICFIYWYLERWSHFSIVPT